MTPLPARYKKRSRLKRRGVLSVEKRPFFKSITIIIFACLGLLVALLLIKFFFGKTFWTGKDKLTLAINEKSGDISLIIFDPRAEEITTVKVPKNTQVNVAGDLGVWKISSVWDLGGGETLVKTITNNLLFPVYFWADSGFENVDSNNPFEVIAVVLIPARTNLSFSDKISLIFFSLRVKNASRREINLSDTTFLQATRLQDGEEGFVLTSVDSPRLYSIFNDYDFLGNSLKIQIKDGTGSYGTAEEVGRILEILGSRASSITHIEGEDYVCRISGKNQKIAEKVSKLFDCAIEEKDIDLNYDLEIILGNKFLL